MQIHHIMMPHLQGWISLLLMNQIHYLVQVLIKVKVPVHSSCCSLKSINMHQRISYAISNWDEPEQALHMRGNLFVSVCCV